VDKCSLYELFGLIVSVETLEVASLELLKFLL